MQKGARGRAIYPSPRSRTGSAIIELETATAKEALNVINLKRYKASYWPTANLFANIAAQAQPRTFSD
jgi:hypothetical protein